MASETSVTITRVVSITFHIVRLSQLELDRDFDDHVHWNPQAVRGGETPLPHRIRGALIEAGAQALQHSHVSDAAVTADHDLHHDVSFDATPASLFRVVRFHFAQDRRRRDPAAGTIWTSARAAARARSDAGAVAGTEAGAGARACSASHARPVTLRLRGRLPRDA